MSREHVKYTHRVLSSASERAYASRGQREASGAELEAPAAGNRLEAAMGPIEEPDTAPATVRAPTADIVSGRDARRVALEADANRGTSAYDWARRA